MPENWLILCEKCPQSGLFGPYSVRMVENTDKNISEYEHFLRSVDQRL